MKIDNNPNYILNLEWNALTLDGEFVWEHRWKNRFAHWCYKESSLFTDVLDCENEAHCKKCNTKLSNFWFFQLKVIGPYYDRKF